MVARQIEFDESGQNIPVLMTVHVAIKGVWHLTVKGAFSQS